MSKYLKLKKNGNGNEANDINNLFLSAYFSLYLLAASLVFLFTLNSFRLFFGLIIFSNRLTISSKLFLNDL